MDRSLKSLKYYDAQKGKPPGQDEWSGVSLVQLPATQEGSLPRLVMLQWVIPGVSGRIADVDENHFLKSIVPVGPKRIPLKLEEVGAKIIVPATGVVLLREKRTAKLRTSSSLNLLPDDLIRLMDMWQAAEGKKLGLETGMETDENCFICSKPCYTPDSGSAEQDIPAATSGDCFTLCPFCLLCSHHECLERVLAALPGRCETEGAVPLPLNKDQSTTSFPELFQDSSRQGPVSALVLKFQFMVWITQVFAI